MMQHARMVAAAGAVAWVLGAALPRACHAAGAPPTVVSGVDVRAPPAPKPPPSRKVLEDYVSAIGAMSLGDQLAIWPRSQLPPGPAVIVGGGAPLNLDDPANAAAGAAICPVVLGLEDAHAQFVLARIRQIGLDAGAPVRRQVCPRSASNVWIVFVDDAPALIHALAAKIPAAFGFRYHGELVQDLHQPVLPARGWYFTTVATTERTGSRLSTPYQSAILSALIIVDLRKVAALDMGQISDYLAMLTLAEIKPAAVPPGARTILNVFADTAAGRAPAKGLTPMDAAYLKALYAVNMRQPGSIQNSQIVDRIRAAMLAR